MRTPGRRRLITILAIVCPVVLACTASYLLIVRSFGPHFAPQGAFMLSADEGWVVGSEHSLQVQAQAPFAYSARRFADAPEKTASYHLHNGSWSEVDVPSVELNKIFEVAPDDAWALSEIDTGMFHFDGRTWSRFSGTETMIVSDLYMVSATDGWAVGNEGIWHYTNGVWQDASALTPSPEIFPNGRPIINLTSVDMVSATDGWAVGLAGRVWHYDGKQWRTIDISAAFPIASYRIDLSSIHMISSQEG